MKKIYILIAAILMIASYSLTAQVAITTDGSSADASAMLEVQSTDKGLLPPRMTEAQRNEIDSPVAGLLVWCIDCGTDGELQVYNGTTWTNMIGDAASAGPPDIGDSYQGGIIAYIFQSGDPGYDANVQHGIIAASSDQSTGIQWCDGDFITTGATAKALGTGNANTNTIVGIQGGGSYAAQFCADLSLGGYDDWYLPSKDELNKLYLNKTAVGGFTSGYYWSSTEFNYGYAWTQFFCSGSQNGDWKDYTNYVRAVRAF